MILPIYLFGTQVLREKSKEIDLKTPELASLISNMYETMYAANGVGLAANQVGKVWRVFVIDASLFYFTHSDENEDRPPNPQELALLQKTYKKVFINPIMIEETGQAFTFQEGCLSMPGIYENVTRHSNIKLSYWDEQGNYQDKINFEGLMARVIQHEYDHIEGKLFSDHISGQKLALLNQKWRKIKTEKNKISYPFIAEIEKI